MPINEVSTCSAIDAAEWGATCLELRETPKQNEHSRSDDNRQHGAEYAIPSFIEVDGLAP